MKNQYQYETLEKLVLKAQKNDLGALNELIKRQQDEIYKTLKYLGADKKEIYDLVQEILFKISNKINSLKNPKYYKSWQNKIVLRHFYDYLRKEKKERINLISLDDEEEKSKKYIIDTTKTPSIKVLGYELDSTIKESISKLSNKLKSMVVMRDIKGLTYNEISKITGLAHGTIKSRLARAREKIREDIKSYIGK